MAEKNGKTPRNIAPPIKIIEQLKIMPKAGVIQILAACVSVVVNRNYLGNRPVHEFVASVEKAARGQKTSG